MARFTRLRRARVSLSYETKLPLLAGAAAVPALGMALLLLWREPWPTGLRLALTLFGIFPPVLMVMMLRDRITFPLRTITNLLAALREGDYSLRAGRQGRLDALGEVMQEINGLGDLLSNHAQKSAEATALLRGVLAEIDLAVFTFDEQDLLQLVNRAGARLLAKAEHRLLGQPASRLGLEKLLLPGSPAIVSESFPGAAGTRWSVRRSAFREGGKPHQLLVIGDVSLALREEERLAWQRLIRVLGHELNNSLGPMRSIADTLLATTQRLVVRLDPEDLADLGGGLQIIRDRADALSRFMEAYGQLAKLPAPRPSEEALGTLVSHVAALPADKRIQLIPGPDLQLWVDRVQLEQVLINLIRNALEAAPTAGGRVIVTWRLPSPYTVEIEVADNGLGLASKANLFVPFFTTKPHGSGIGLVLSRQVIEAHGGTLNLENRGDHTAGCLATVRLPLKGRPSQIETAASSS